MLRTSSTPKCYFALLGFNVLIRERSNKKYKGARTLKTITLLSPVSTEKARVRMKTQIAGLMCALLLAGCAPEAVKGYVVGEEAHASMGSTMVWWSPKGEMTGGVWEQSRMELIYSGISGTTLKISYRESKEYFDTPNSRTVPQPNSLDLTYDISTSKEISYQDMSLLVISADSKEIVFKVLKGPGEMPDVQTEKTN
jgi:hypothetical protein